MCAAVCRVAGLINVLPQTLQQHAVVDANDGIASVGIFGQLLAGTDG